MVVEVPPSRKETPMYFGYGGPRGGQAPDLPLVYLPRGLDNSSGGQVYVDSDRWGPLQGLMVHTSFGANSHFLLLRDEVDGQAQGAAVPLVGEFLSGSHRGRLARSMASYMSAAWRVGETIHPMMVACSECDIPGRECSCPLPFTYMRTYHAQVF